MSRTDEILGLLRRAAQPLDDDEIGAQLAINRQYVNTVCNGLANRGEIVRYIGPDGKIVNTIDGSSEPTPAMIPPNVRQPTHEPRQRTRTDRTRANVDALVGEFVECVDRFERSNAFPGPSLYFHERAIDTRRSYATAAEAIGDDRFLELIYAVLPAWGMHRMGRQAAKVGEFVAFAESIREQEAKLDEYWDMDIRLVSQDSADDLARDMWGVISSLKVSTSRTTIVAGSKTLHHLLPDLVPPIDRQYTFRFFTGQMAVGDERRAFAEWFPLFCEIGRSCAPIIAGVLDRRGFMATSASKVIDNAIMGFRQGQLAS